MLADLFNKGYLYCSLNAYRSTISSVHEEVDGYEVGQHPLVTRLIKGAFHERPPQPRYTQTWDVAKVTTYIEALGNNDSLQINVLTTKTVVLMEFTRPSRSADLLGLSLEFGPRENTVLEGVTFRPTRLAKQSNRQRN